MKYLEKRRKVAIKASAIANNLAVRLKGKYLRVFGDGSITFVAGLIVAKVTSLFELISVALDLYILKVL